MHKFLLLFLLLISTNATPNETMDRVECLARNIYFEARGESLKGKLAVAHVTLNRKKSAKYPKTICDVVYQKHQFSWTSKQHRITNQSLFDEIKDLAHSVIMGETEDPTKGALNFHNRSVQPNWNKRVRVIIGNHIFY
jgi:spore germination cell wall hydrolase CwlJ-like protein